MWHPLMCQLALALQIAKRQLLDFEESHKQLAQADQNSQRRILAFGFSSVIVILNRAESSR